MDSSGLFLHCLAVLQVVEMELQVQGTCASEAVACLWSPEGRKSAGEVGEEE